MDQAEIEKWERWYYEAAERDFARQIYAECDKEDALRGAEREKS